MDRSALEIADIFRDHGAAWRHANRGHVSLDQLKVMSAWVVRNPSQFRTHALQKRGGRMRSRRHRRIVRIWTARSFNFLAVFT
jgi:hypothetical protein